MILNNIKYAFRNLKRDRFYSLLNGLGLTVGMTVALLIFMWAAEEISYDNYHSKKDRIYRVLLNSSFGGERHYGYATPAPLSAATREKVPEVEEVATLWHMWSAVLKNEQNLLNVEHAYLADPAILNIFDFEFIEGTASSALENPNSIVLTKRLSHKIFGSSNAMGKTISLNEKLTLSVSGIINDAPENSHLKIECLIPFEKNISSFMGEGSLHWGASNYRTYALLKPNVDAVTVGKKMTDLQPLREGEPKEERSFFELQNIENVHLGSSHLSYKSESSGSWLHIRLLSFIGLLILLIASINYINLTTARVAHKAKATGIRKIIGASKSQLIGQHLVEATVLITCSALVALMLTHFSLPLFEELSGKSFSGNAVFAPSTLLILTAIALATILLSGIQPAVQMATFRPSSILNGEQLVSFAGKLGLRKVLVVFQFVSSAALIICTLFMMRQLHFVQASNLGYEKEHVFNFMVRNQHIDKVSADLKSKTGINEVSMSDQSIVNIVSQMGGFTWEGMPEEEDMSIYQIVVDDSFKDFFGLELKEGRWFNPGVDDSKSYIINESAVKALQLESPVGKWIDFWGDRGMITGVVKDFHFRSFHHDIEQLIFRQNSEYLSRVYVKTTGANAGDAIASAEAIFKKHQPNSVFEYNFLDESYDQLYKSETKMGQLFLFFALIAILISCLGIFGLATYTAEKRFKEIGVRKVLGASVMNIVGLLTKDFLLLVVVSLIIAIPLAWYFMNSWLDNFAYHVNLDWWVFVGAGILALIVAFATVGFQSYRAALSNPVESIKVE